MSLSGSDAKMMNNDFICNHKNNFSGIDYVKVLFVYICASSFRIAAQILSQSKESCHVNSAQGHFLLKAIWLNICD